MIANLVFPGFQVQFPLQTTNSPVERKYSLNSVRGHMYHTDSEKYEALAIRYGFEGALWYALAWIGICGMFNLKISFQLVECE